MASGRAVRYEKISPWIVLILGVVTLGIYSVVWTSRRYAERGSPTKWSHWSVPIGAALVMFVLAVALLATMPFVMDDMRAAAEIGVYGSLAMGLLMCVAMTCWMAHYVGRMSAKLKQPMPYWAIFVTTLLFSPVLAAYMQYRMNDTAAQLSFLVPTLVGAALGVAGIAVLLIIAPPQQEIESLKGDYINMRQELRHIEQLSGDYEKCVNDLDAAYPTDQITDDNYAEYKARYDACDEIYKEIQDL